MLIKDLLSKLEASEPFKSWQKSNPDACLAHLFCMVEKDASSWQAGYHDTKMDTITSFDIDGDTVTIRPPESIFKKEGMNVKELEREKIMVDLDDVLATAKELQERKYPSEKPIKRIIVLQTFTVGPVYNVTYVTKSFKTLNMKISSETGKVVEDQLAAIFSFDNGEKKEDKLSG